MKITEMAFVCYPVTDVARAKAFYEGVLNLKATHVYEEGSFAWIEYDIGAATLALCNCMPNTTPTSNGPCVALEVDDIESALAVLKAHQVTVLSDNISPVCRSLMLRDPDGNSLMIHKRKA